MLRFEIKKIFSKPKNKIAVVLLFVVLIITSILTINRVEYVDENGNHSVGISASHHLREAKNEWAGYLTCLLYTSKQEVKPALMWWTP